jgi:hypothetical protein
LVGIAQFHERRYGLRHIGGSLLAPLGWEDYQRRQGITELNELIVPPDDRSSLFVTLARWLDQGRWIAALVPGVSPEAALPPGLARRIVSVGKPYALFRRDLPATWDDLVSGLGKSMRDNVKYYPRLLLRHGHHVEFRVHETAAEMPEALHAFFRLHRARSQASAGVAHPDKFASRDRRDFLSDVAPALADRGRLKIGLLGVNGETVAAQMWFEMRNTLFVYYTGWNPDWYKYSVQLVATLECLKHGMARGIRRVEFLRAPADGTERNERWGTTKQVRVNLTLARRPAITSLLLRAPQLRRKLRLVTTARDPLAAQFVR